MGNFFERVSQGAGASPVPQAHRGRTGGPEIQAGFAEALRRASSQASSGEKAIPQSPVALSGHAAERLRARGVPVTGDLISTLSKAVDALAAKQARESLVVVGGVGYVVNVRSRTVVTALPLQGEEPQIFTNIDSALFARV